MESTSHDLFGKWKDITLGSRPVFMGRFRPSFFLSSFVHLSITVSERHKGKKPCPFFSRPFLFDFHHMQEIIQRNEQKRGK